jgi:hypothetical protein
LSCNLDLRKEIKRGTSVYNGVFNLLVLQGARDWMTGDVPQYGDLDDHHIVPDAWGKKHIKDGLSSSILNRTPLTAESNRPVIKAQLPNEYLPELIKQSKDSPGNTRNAFYIGVCIRHPATQAFYGGRFRGLHRRAPAHHSGCNRESSY